MNKRVISTLILALTVGSIQANPVVISRVISGFYTLVSVSALFDNIAVLSDVYRDPKPASKSFNFANKIAAETIGAGAELCLFSALSRHLLDHPIKPAYLACAKTCMRQGAFMVGLGLGSLAMKEYIIAKGSAPAANKA